MALKVLLADDHRLLMLGICKALEQAEDIEVVGEAVSGSQLLPLIHQTHPDLVLLDLSLPDMSAVACEDAIRARYPSVKVAALSATTAPEEVDAAYEHGVVAFIVKTIEPEELPSALRRAYAEAVPRVIGGEGEQDGAGLDLTARELAMLRGLLRGLSNGALSREFFVTQQTVKFHLSNLYRKLGVANRTEAAYVAHTHGIAESEARV